MAIGQRDFIALLGGSSLHKALKSSLLPFKEGERPPRVDQFSAKLHAEIVNGRYFPSIPRGYIVMNKHRGVARIIPVLSYADNCVYYYCIKRLEEAIAVNRVAGTFGGWTLGNPFRALEEREAAAVEDDWKERQSLMFVDDDYAPSGSYDPMKWAHQWSEFQRLAYFRAQGPGVTSFVEYDIANFYDNINLDLLERKIRLQVDPALSDVVDLMFVLLRFWNRQFQGYGPKSSGIPQDDAGDYSRILANFYLQEFDTFMSKWCMDGAHTYLRYADDQIIMSRDLPILRNQLTGASAELHKIGLNINSGKVREFTRPEEFNRYWVFEMFENLADASDRPAVNDAANTFVQQIPSDVDDGEWRWYSVYKRLLSVGFNGIDLAVRNQIVEFALLPGVLSRLEHQKLRQLKRALSDAERQKMDLTLLSLVDTVPHNAFHLGLLKYFGSSISRQTHLKITRRLNQIELFAI